MDKEGNQATEHETSVTETQLLIPKENIAVFKRRWAFLFGIFLINSTSMFSSVCFGLIDDIFTGYFNITYAEGDWITLAVYATSCLAIPILAWLCFSNQMGIRLLILVETFFLSASYLLIVISIAYPKLYLCIIFGQLLHGITNAIQWSIPPLFAVLWFPNNEVGIAIAANFIGAALGAGIGFGVPPRVLREPPSVIPKVDGENMTIVEGAQIHNASRSWKEEDRQTLLEIFLTMFVITIFLLVFFFIYLTDLPPKPPTIAQALKRSSQNDKVKKLNKENLKEYFELLKFLFTDMTFVSLLIVYSVVHRAVMLEFTLMGELIRAIAPTVDIDASPDEIGSYVMIFYPISTATGSVVSGKLLDYFGKYQKQAIVGAGMTFLSTFGIAISYYFRSFVAICVFNTGFGFSTRICIISLLAVVTRHTYPVSESFVSIWVTGFESFVLIVISEVGRLLIKDVNGVSVLIFMSSSLLFSFVLALLTKPRDKRLEAEQAVTLQGSFSSSQLSTSTESKSESSNSSSFKQPK